MSLPDDLPPGNSSEAGLPAAVASRGKDQSQLDFDLGFFAKVLLRNPDYVDVLRCQGQLLSRKGKHADALSIDRRLVTLRPQDAVAHYNLACSLSLLGYARDALVALRAALANGYCDYAYLEQDADLDAVRDEPAYLEMLKEFGISS